MARLFYSMLFYLLMPLVLLRLLYRAWKAPAYARRWRERFGWFDLERLPRDLLWVHAVSVGETIAAVPMIQALQQRYPHYAVMVTTTTPTGSERVKAMLGETVLHVYAPYDLPGAVKRFLRRVKPRLLIVMETELWPNMLHYTRRSGVSVILANARLSERSSRGYSRVGFIARPMLADLSLIAAQAQADAQRFVGLGVAQERVHVVGSIKFDLKPREDQLAEGRRLRRSMSRRLVWVAASTHEGEDELILEAHRILRAQVTDALLILVPRHPERFKSVYELVKSRGLAVARRSLSEAAAADHAVWLGDTMGEMMMFFAAADAAFVGGSLVERGGHNPLEPASLGLPVLMGPHVYNFQEICNRLSDAGGLIYVGSAANLADRLLELAEDEGLRAQVGGQGRELLEQSRGALERLLRLIELQLRQ